MNRSALRLLLEERLAEITAESAYYISHLQSWHLLRHLLDLDVWRSQEELDLLLVVHQWGVTEAEEEVCKDQPHVFLFLVLLLHVRFAG